MKRSLLPILLLAGAGIVALSLVPAWLVHVRHVGGHGLTEIVAVWSAWEGRAWPILPIGVVAAALVALFAGLQIVRPGRVPLALLLGGSVVALGSFLATLAPLERSGYASRVEMSAGWPVLVSVGVVAGMVAAAAWSLAGRRGVLVAAAATVIVAVAGYGVRVVALNLAEGDPRSYTTGTYSRPAADGETDTLLIGESTYRLGDRWSGSFEGRGLVVVLTDDPACPSDRGSYRIFPAGGDAIRWNTIVDLCADGARARDLTTGVWEPAD